MAEIKVESLAVQPGTAIRAPFAFRAVGATWQGDATASIQVSVSDDGFNWKQSVELRADGDAEIRSDGRVPGRLVFLDEPAGWIEVRVTSGSASDIRLYLIDPGVSTQKQISIERNAASAQHVVSREEWGCPKPEGPAGKSYSKVTHLIVHHTADKPPTSGDSAAWVRAIWAYHVNSNGWADVGYNYLIDGKGTIFEGRAGGPGVTGAHFSCINSGTMGVAMLGTFTTLKPSDAGWQALVQLLAWRAADFELDPLARTMHSSGGAVLDVISGHRDSSASPKSCTVTECPGNALYPMLPELRKNVAEVMAAPAGLTWTPTGLWHRTETGEWWYANEKTAKYATGEEANSGELESAEFQVTSDTVLRFRSWYETENTTTIYDEKYVEISVDSGAWERLAQISGTAREWVEWSIPLKVWGPVRVRFRFDTVDGVLNEFAGWRIEKIEVRAQ